MNRDKKSDQLGYYDRGRNRQEFRSRKWRNYGKPAELTPKAISTRALKPMKPVWVCINRLLNTNITTIITVVDYTQIIPMSNNNQLGSSVTLSAVQFTMDGYESTQRTQIGTAVGLSSLFDKMPIRFRHKQWFCFHILHTYFYHIMSLVPMHGRCFGIVKFALEFSNSVAVQFDAYLMWN